MPSELRGMIVAELTERVGKLSDCAFVDLSGLNAQQTRDLRVKLRGANGQLLVVKNSLVRRALPASADAALGSIFAGSTAVAHGKADPAVLLRTLIDWGRKNRPIPLKGGIVDGRPMTAQQMGQVAALPPRDVLRARLLATIMAPMAGLLRLLNEPKRRLVSILDQRAKQGAEGAAPSQA